MARIFIVLLGVLAGANVYASNATVQIDQTEIERDQTVTAVFTYKGQLNSEPDFSVLEEDFTIVSQALSKSVEIINRNYREQQTWTTVLLPKREGALVLPPVAFGNEKTNAITLNVAPPKPRTGQDLGDLFLETELTPDNHGYVQQQHIFTVRIYFRGWLIDGQLSDPRLDNQDVVVQSLGEPRRYSTTRNGERYQVYERRHALFPQSSGEMTIGKTTFSGRLRLPVGGNRLKSVSTPAITRNVNPVPAEFTGDVWLPAESLTLTEVWPGNSLVFEQGVPITRTISVNANGLTAAQLPTLKLQGNDEVRVYPDQPRSGDQVGEKGMIGTRTMSVALVPQQTGEIVLPAIEVVWWDTTADRQRTARLDEKILSVLTGNGVAVDESTTAGRAEVVNVEQVSLFANPWFFATVFCGAGWLITLLFRRKKRESPDLISVYQPTGIRLRLKKACKNNDAKACGRLLGEFLRADTSQSAHAARMLDQVDGEELKRQWQALNRILYGPESDRTAWTGGNELWRAFDKVSSSKMAQDSHTSVLAPLAPSA